MFLYQCSYVARSNIGNKKNRRFCPDFSPLRRRPQLCPTRTQKQLPRGFCKVGHWLSPPRTKGSFSRCLFLLGVYLFFIRSRQSPLFVFQSFCLQYSRQRQKSVYIPLQGTHLLFRKIYKHRLPTNCQNTRHLPHPQGNRYTRNPLFVTGDHIKFGFRFLRLTTESPSIIVTEKENSRHYAGIKSSCLRSRLARATIMEICCPNRYSRPVCLPINR